MWSDLKETYDKVDGSVVFNLHKSFNSLSQNGAPLAEYYNNLNSLWKQFDTMISLPHCTCKAAKHFEKHNQLIKLMQFLMGLDESYLAIKSNILTRETLPLAKATFAIICGEELHRNGATKPAATAFVVKTFDNKSMPNNNSNFNKGSGSNSNSNNRGPNPNLKCTNCNKICHTVDRCFKLVGYPVGYIKMNFNSSTMLVSSNNLSILMNLLNDNGVSSANANMVVGHPNGTQALIIEIGDLKISNDITLYDVLVVPEYTISLLSVHMIARDSRSQSMNMEIESTPALVLDDECLNSKDLSNSLLGRVKAFASLSNLKMLIQASMDFTIDGRVVWVDIEGIPFKMWSINTFKRIAFKWCVLLHIDDQEDECFHTKRMFINTKVGMNILESFKIIYRRKVFWIRAKEVPGWVPDFMEETDEDYDSDDGLKEGGLKVKDVASLGGERDVEEVPETKLEEILHNQNLEEASTGQKDKHSEDPFNLYPLLNKKSNVVDRGNNSNYSLKFPPGYTPTNDKEEHCKKDEESKKESGDYSQGHYEEELNNGIKDKCSNKGSKEDVAESVCSSEVVIMGDFNKVHNKTERFGSIFNVQGANVFNMFISNAGLEEVPLGGSSFTWCHKSASKISKLDRFLISESLMSSCPNISAITLERYLSDHRHILLRFDKLVEDTWIEAPMDESNAMTNMMMKLKYLKQKIREWNKGKIKSAKNRKIRFKEELPALDVTIDKGEGNAEVVKQRMDVIKSLQDMENLQSLETAQKAKIKWAIEGDENSRYYHGVLNKKRNQLNIRGILVEGIWTDNPCMVKREFLQHFKKMFDKPNDNRIHLDMNYPKMLSSDQQVELDLEVSKEEIKRAVWIAGLINHLVRTDLRVVFIVASGRSSRGLIIVNGSPTEEFQFYKGLKQGDPLSPFLFILIMESLHISFQRVVDAGMFKGIMLSSSLQLSNMFYADDVVFLEQWSDANFDTIVHVLECFFRASGLRINMSKSKLMGISVEKDKVEREASKIGCLILKPPFSYLGPKVGGLMSRVQSWNEVVDRVIARLSKWKMKTLSIGGRLTLLKSVLGLMPIYLMSIFKVPMSVLHRLESIHIHFFGSHDLNSKKTSWVKWKNVLASKEKGGLGVSSLYALNRGLMFKWVWRFFTQNTSLWTRVIKAIHREDGKVGKNVKSGFPSIWLDIVHEMDALETCKVMDVATKLAHSSLESSFRRVPRGGVEQEQYKALMDQVHDVSLVLMRSRRIWSLKSSGDFSVASVRKLIDDKMLPKVATKTRWIKFVPIKVNVLAWKVRLDSLPTRLNISRRELNFEIEDLPVNTVRRSSRQTKLPASLNDFSVEGKVKYGVEKVVNYSNLSVNNYIFAFSLNKSIEPTCYKDAILDGNWIDAMNAKIEALNRKLIGCKWIFKIKYKANGEIESVLNEYGFVQSVNDHSMLTKSKDNKIIALLVYVDEFVITGNCVHEIDQFKTYLKSKFNIKDLGSLKYFFGIEVIKTGDDISLSQRKYCLELLKEYAPTKTNPLLDNITGYQKLLGKLIYLTHTRPDITYSVHCLAQYMHSPLKSHLNCALNVLRYLKNAPCKGIKYVYSDCVNNLQGYCDADWAKCLKTRKSVIDIWQQTKNKKGRISPNNLQSARVRNRTSRPQNQDPNGQNLPLYARKLQSKNRDDPTVQTPGIDETLLLGFG
ncbi:RNA-directed DNA polymerase, eukaryota, reverse transcriptase zinc-binding domain protein [Tanacetum coccineum]